LVPKSLKKGGAILADYFLHGDNESLYKILDAFKKACHAEGVSVGTLKVAIIIMRVLDKGKDWGVIEEFANKEAFLAAARAESDG